MPKPRLGTGLGCVPVGCGSVAVLIDDSDGFVFELATDVTGGRYHTARDTARSRVDLRRVVERYAGVELTETAEGYKARCFLPSAVNGFAGTCAEQDESEGHPGQNLSVTLAEDGTHWRWRCFSCGRGQTRDGARPGDVVDLVTAAEGFHVNEGNTGSLKGLRFALRLGNLDHVLDGLAKPRAGRAPVDVSLIVDNPVKAAKRTEPKVSLETALEINSRARKHWQLALKAGTDSAHARTYLAARGVTPAQIKRYAIGYARNRFNDLVGTLDPKTYPPASAMGASAGPVSDAAAATEFDAITESPEDVEDGGEYYAAFDVPIGEEVEDVSDSAYLASLVQAKFELRLSSEKDRFGDVWQVRLHFAGEHGRITEGLPDHGSEQSEKGPTYKSFRERPRIAAIIEPKKRRKKKD